MALTEIVRTVGDIAEIVVTILLTYVVFRIATLLDTLNRKIKEEKPI
jgi:ABC-type uncharacterized transport system permease subunit